MTSRLHVAGRNQLLAALRPHNWSLIEPYVQRLLLKKGQILHDVGCKIDFVYFPTGALISLIASLQTGEIVETAALGSDGIVGAMAGLYAEYAWSKSVVSIAGTALRISADNLEVAARSSAQIRDLIFHSNAALFAQVQQTCACNTLHDVRPRVSRWLLDTAAKTGRAAVPTTQKSFSALLGIHRGTLNAVLGGLQDEGIIEIKERGRIVIAEPEKLESMACECFGVARRLSEQLLMRLNE